MNNPGVRLWTLLILPLTGKADMSGVLMLQNHALHSVSLCAISSLIKVEIPVREDQSHKGTKSIGAKTL